MLVCPFLAILLAKYITNASKLVRLNVWPYAVEMGYTSQHVTSRNVNVRISALYGSDVTSSLTNKVSTEVWAKYRFVSDLTRP